MKILVLSDTHSALRFARMAIEKLKPDTVIHLGDYYDDGKALAEEFFHIPFLQVPGNCDTYRCPPDVHTTLFLEVGGVMLLMTHGHKHYVKQTYGRIIDDGLEQGADGVLFGHTHEPYCCQEGDMWVLNPGSCGHSGGSVGLIETDGEMITACSLLWQENLDALS